MIMFERLEKFIPNIFPCLSRIEGITQVPGTLGIELNRGTKVEFITDSKYIIIKATL